MDTFDGNLDDFMRPDGGDDRLFVVFYTDAVKNEGKTLEAGRPIFDDTVCCRIMVPGDRNNVIDRPATEVDKRRFAKQFAAFQQGMKEEEQISGVRLRDWPYLTKGQVEEFRYLGLHTVEQLAGVRDDVLQRVPGMTRLKQHAKVWLERSESTAKSAAIDKRMNELQAQNDALARELAKLRGTEQAKA